MPVWHKKTQEWVKSGKLIVIGITQEQHSDRCRLFAQWQGLDWPILWDPINVLESTAVPIVTAIDEHGIVRLTKPRPETLEAEFLNISFSDNAGDSPLATIDPDGQTPRRPLRVELLDAATAELEDQAEQERNARRVRDLADAMILWGGTDQVNAAIKFYDNSLQQQADDAATRFRLGVAFRLRYDSALRQPDDFANAVKHWEQALQLNPNQYIWRRRIQQYGPRLEKPYSFYDWVQQARDEIVARGETPLPLVVEPQAAELAQPARDFGVDSATTVSPDPEGRIQRDTKSLIVAEITRVPSIVRPGGSAQVHIAFYPNAALPVQWNNESEPLQFWIEPPAGWRISQRLQHVAPTSNLATSREVRRLDFEIQVPPEATGTVKIPAYALYYVCEDTEGTCQYLRQDLEIEVTILHQDP